MGRPAGMDEPFIRQITIVESRVADASAFPFTLPAVQALDGLPLAPVTYFVGENASSVPLSGRAAGSSSARELLQSRDEHRGARSRPRRRAADHRFVRRTLAPRAVALRVVPRAPPPSLRRWRALRARRAGGRALARAPDRARAAHPRAHRERLAIHHRDPRPHVLSYPDATIYELGARGIGEVDYDDAAPVRVTRDFLANREAHLARILTGD